MRPSHLILSLCLAVPGIAQDTGEAVRTVLVLDEHGDPVIGAEVAFRAADERDLTTNTAVDCERAFDGRPRYRSDAKGLATLPTDLCLAAVMARAGERFGAASLAFDDLLVAQQILQIAPDRTVQVDVRGADGKPRAGVPVEVKFPQSQWDEFYAGAETHVGETDAEGQLTIFHAQTLCTWDLAHPILRLRARVAGVDSPFVSLDLREQVSAPVALACPPFGRLVVRRWLAEGIRDGVLPDMYAWWVREDEKAFSERVRGHSSIEEGGEWRSHPVALGQTWWLYGARRVVEAAGPKRDQEQVLVDIYESIPQPKYRDRVSGTVVLELPDGTPCANANVLLGEPDDRHNSRTPRARTDSQGRVHFAVHRPSSSFALSFFVPGPNLVAYRKVSQDEAENEVVDLGSLRLRTPRHAVTGRMLDATTRLAVRGKVTVSGGAFAFGVPTSADGTFVIWDDPETISRSESTCEVYVDARCWIYPEAKRTVAVGARDVVFALERPPVLRCRVIADPHIAAGLLDLRAEHVGGEELWLSRARSRGGLLEYGQRISGDLLAPGGWSLTIQGGDELEILQTERGVGFERSPDGLTATLDLTGQLAEFDLFIPQYMHPGEGGWFVVRERGTNVPWRMQYLHDHRSLLWKAGAKLDAILCPRDNPAAQIVLSPGTTTFALPPAPTFEIEVHGPEVPDDASLSAHVLLLDRNEPLIDEAERSGFQDEHGNPGCSWPLPEARLAELIGNRSGTTIQPGEVRTEVSRLGKYVVLPFLWREEGEDVLFPDEAIVLEAKAPGEVVKGTLRLDPTKVKAALDGK